MTKRLTILLVASLTVLIAHAQEWTTKDSLKINRLLNGKEELKLNLEAVKFIDLGMGMGKPRMSDYKAWMLPDETLPLVLPNKKKVILTLHPYTIYTKYNWDPIYQRKIKVGNGMGKPTIANYQKGVSLGGGVSVYGGTIGGLNLMRIFEKDFWDKAGRDRRARTLEVLKQYGDSTTVLINHAVMQPIIR